VPDVVEEERRIVAAPLERLFGEQRELVGEQVVDAGGVIVRTVAEGVTEEHFRREIDSLKGKVQEKGLTLVPTRLYFKNGRAKVELAVARGKETRDKRRDIAKREADRQIERALKSRSR